jgi:putative spermidine/putrescine transport system ATP-binding protein
MTQVRFESIVKTYGQENALAQLSLEVQSGELLSILGPSGSGKTTALRILAGFETATSGRVFIGEDDVTDLSPQSRNLGMVFQSYSLFPNMTVTENITFALTMRKWPKDSHSTRIDELIDMVRLAKHRNKYPHQLSGGQQQRVALARAMATKPPLLLLDEPLSALDQAVRERLRVDIRNVQQNLGVTTIFVTHDQHEAMAMSDRIAVMNEGRLVQLGTPLDVYSAPNSTFTAQFMGQMNSVPARRVGQQWEVLGTQLSQQATSPSGTAYIRPENLSVTKIQTGNGTISSMSFLGSITRCKITVGDVLVTAELPTPDAAGLHTGDRVQVAPLDVPILVDTTA